LSRPPRNDRDAPRRPYPTDEEILEFLRDQPGKVGKREIARAFGLRGDDKIWLKQKLKALQDAGRMERGRGRELTPAGKLPAVAVLDMIEIDLDGDLLGRPANWTSEQPPPKVVMQPVGRGQPQLGIGDRVLARTAEISPGLYEARLIRLLQARPEQVIGVYRLAGRDGRVQPADKKERDEFAVDIAHSLGAQSGEVVVIETLPGRALGLKRGKVVERLGRFGDPRSLSLMAVHQHGIPTRFGEDALREAEEAKPVRVGQREDLRDLPLVTIDPEDARDHDDAVFAEPDQDPDNPGGWHVIVAIADVSWYVRPGSALDRDARERGNSTYFPDRVVPMLPEKLSADLCSLVAGKSRACIACHIWFDRDGNKRRHRFTRALMKSRADLNYSQVQQAVDGKPDRVAGALMAEVIEPLYGAYRAVAGARDRRGPLALDLPERKIQLGPDGFIQSIKPRERHESHRLIEEFMILANVCAAETLEAMRQPCMYRLHDAPSSEKLEALREFLETLGLGFPRGQMLRPRNFNDILARASRLPQAQLISEVVLRTQSQAVYGSENIGHFGLNLRKYAHFTSPIRRYADLLVHRALVSGGRFGEGGLSDWDREHFDEVAQHISTTERRSMAAERDALDRFTAAYLSDRVGATFRGRIAGVARFGLFVKLDETGADGFIPVSTIGGDFFRHDETRHSLIGERSGLVFQLGDQLEVRLAEATPVSGGLRFELLPGQGRLASADERRAARRQPRQRPGREPRKRYGKRP